LGAHFFLLFRTSYNRGGDGAGFPLWGKKGGAYTPQRKNLPTRETSNRGGGGIIQRELVGGAKDKHPIGRLFPKAHYMCGGANKQHCLLAPEEIIPRGMAGNLKKGGTSRMWC